jgi:extracellular elastinolytic metalloproteinase
LAITSAGRSEGHTALDATVVFHEFFHGVSKRLVGGPANTTALDATQSAGMGEGWSDFVACTLCGVNVVAAWALNSRLAIRRFPYDDKFPDGFGALV